MLCYRWSSPRDSDDGVKATNLTDPLAVPDPIQVATLDEIQRSRKVNIERLKVVLVDMHKRTANANKNKRAAGRKHDNEKRHDDGPHARAKLRVKWCGPAQVTAATSNWIVEIENLITGERREVHASRLKFYADSSLEVTEGLLRHVAHNREGHVVDSLLAARCNAQEKRHELKVHWRGLSEDEDSWEPAAVFLQDVPVAVKAFVKAHRKDESVDVLGKALGLSLD
ncbi:Hypothetical protein PHPALM_8212 [Phytophthora palmivora]|uniref:Chromo domain-containing protein n=1 Tax=Phytophthora palmivora TaxID=4796 RepID=A0A2P4YAD2_9STRA|nr:Hypothetical protein PHPALM_8212 [Phytophthora palmivora]